MSIKALIFDLGNTLMYFDGSWSKALRVADRAMAGTLVKAGYQLDADRFDQDFRVRLRAYYVERENELVELTTAHILRTLLADYGYPSVPDAVILKALESLYHETQVYWTPEEDAYPTLKTLKDQGYRLGVISNAGDDADVQHLVDKVGVRSCLDFVITSAACGIRKPAPQIFQLALAHWDFLPGQVAMVGDTLNADVLGGQKSGLYTIWITRRADTLSNQEHQDTIHPDAVIDTLAELPGLLAGLG